MKRLKHISIPALILICCLIPFLTSCRKVVIDSQEKELFLTYRDAGFYPQGTPHFTYSQKIHQMCTNPQRCVFRIQTNVQDTCMNIIMESIPSKEGDLIMADLDYSDQGERITDRFQFECSKQSGNKTWLWDGYTKIGVIIQSQ